MKKGRIAIFQLQIYYFVFIQYIKQYQRQQLVFHQCNPMQESFFPSIWSPSACSIPYVNRSPSLERSKRFQFGSIYYKDDPFKPKTQEDPLSRPQIILNEFRKKIKEAAKNYHTMSHLLKKKKSELSDGDKYSTINLKATQITNRLYQSPSKLLLLKYDSNGNRSSFFQEANRNEKENQSKRSLSPKEFQLQKIQAKQSDNIYITSTPRRDLSKPLNFFPGPGSYYYREDQTDKFSSVISHQRSGSSLMSSVKNKKRKYETIDSSSMTSEKKNKLFASRLQKSFHLHS